MLFKTIVRLLLFAVITTTLVGTVTSVPLDNEHYVGTSTTDLFTNDIPVSKYDLATDNFIVLYDNDRVLSSDEYYIYSRNNTELEIRSFGGLIQVKSPGKTIKTFFRPVVKCILPTEIGSTYSLMIRNIYFGNFIPTKWETYEFECAE